MRGRGGGGSRAVTGRGGRGRRAAADRGVTAVEFVGWVPLVLVVALAAIQLGVAGFAALQAGSGARAAARAASQEELADRYEATGRGAMSGWLADSATFELSGCGTEATVTASVPVPSVLPLVPDFGRASKSVTMPCD